MTTRDVSFQQEVVERFGVLPNFFCSASAAPGLIEELWGFAKSAYLDNPLPPLFKGRLFVHLSRFCEVRYCIVRHVGFLMGLGRPAGSHEAIPQTAEEVVTLLSRPLPSMASLQATFERLEGLPTPVEFGDPGTEAELDLFDALAVIFLEPRQSERARDAVRNAVGAMRFELLVAYLAFIRTAHYWTETHPELAYEADMLALMGQQPDLKRLMLDTSDAELVRSGEILQRALSDLRDTQSVLQQHRTRESFLLDLSDQVRPLTDPVEILQVAAQTTSRHLKVPRVVYFLVEADQDSATVVAECCDEPLRPGPHEQISLNETYPAIAAELRAGRDIFVSNGQAHSFGPPESSVSRAAIPVTKDGRLLAWLDVTDPARNAWTAEECRLLREVADRTWDAVERVRAQSKLRYADRRKDEFIATLAHELRGPLAPLRNGIQIVRLASASDPTQRRALDMMDRQVSQLVRLVDDLLDVRRIQSGQLDLRRSRVVLTDVLAHSAEAAQVLIDSHKHELIITSPDEELCVFGDFERLSQTITNLLSNAAKYTDPGGRISLTLAREKDEAVITVADNGIGIPPSELANIFNLFSQVRAHQSLAEGGLGIGLSLVKQLVALHDGTVEAHSEGAGRGSTFTIRLALLRHSATEQGSVPHKPLPPRKELRRRVLVVDDNEDARTSLAELLQLLGYPVWTANDGVDALEKAESLHPDLVFMDVGMPRMDGIEAAKHLRAQANGDQLLLVALTGWGQDVDRQRTDDAGFDTHLVKPVELGALEKVLGGTSARPTATG